MFTSFFILYKFHNRFNPIQTTKILTFENVDVNKNSLFNRHLVVFCYYSPIPGKFFLFFGCLLKLVCTSHQITLNILSKNYFELKAA